MRKPVTEPRRKSDPGKSANTSRRDWIFASLRTLRNDGIEAVRVELVAKTLAVTKGSFYWHFENRAALHTAMLKHWRQRATTDVITEVESAATDPLQKLHHLMTISVGNNNGAKLDIAIRAWASHDRAAAKAVLGVDKKRIKYVSELLRQIGHKPDVANARARIIYLTLIGSYFTAGYETAKASGAHWRELEQLIVQDRA